jgi:hypothetical protein
MLKTPIRWLTITWCQSEDCQSAFLVNIEEEVDLFAEWISKLRMRVISESILRSGAARNNGFGSAGSFPF